jgi:hypothetical protein
LLAIGEHFLNNGFPCNFVHYYASRGGRLREYWPERAVTLSQHANAWHARGCTHIPQACVALDDHPTDRFAFGPSPLADGCSRPAGISQFSTVKFTNVYVQQPDGKELPARK